MLRMIRTTLAVAVSLHLSGSAALALQERMPLPSEPLVIHAEFEQRLVVKFADHVRARVEGTLVSRTGADLAAARHAAESRGIRFEPLIRLPESRLLDLEARARANSGRAQPDLAGMMIAVTPDAQGATLLDAAEALSDLPAVEWVSLECVGTPPPFDIPPTTSDYSGNQGYRAGNPGIDSDYAWAQGITGQGIRISDCEYGWNPTHEDFNDIDLHLEPGQTIHPDVIAYGWHEHGTAVLGETSATVDGYGCSGMAHGAEVYTYPEWTVEEGWRRTACITSAIANSGAGDIVILEMQANGAGGGYGPAELDLSVWTVVKAGADAGVIVVGAAGNGSQNLDSAPYEPYMNRGDSGAIIVGAGTNNTAHSTLSFSTYGSRVNLQGWGTGVFSTGYGSYDSGGGDPNQYYTSGFNGTSSATPIVSAACALMQSYMLQTHGTLMSPAMLRQHLIDTGWPQGAGGHIGPFVNLQAAFETQLVGIGDMPWGGGDAPKLGNHPNPFTSATTLSFELARPAGVRLAIYDLSGRKVRSLLEASRGAGRHTILWDGRDDAGRRASSGVYFYRVETGARVATRKVLRLD